MAYGYSEYPDQLRIFIRPPSQHTGARIVLGSIPGFWNECMAEEENEERGVREHLLSVSEAEALAAELLSWVAKARGDHLRIDAERTADGDLAAASRAALLEELCAEQEDKGVPVLEGEK
jgi:hypothetical protein